jgi:sensor c-di-GMP phosphodiesterase-like protein
MDENIRKILEYLQTQIENHVTWTNWDDSLFDKLNIDKSQNPRLLSILKSKNYIDTMEPIGDLKAVSINDNGTTYLVNFDNKKLEPKTIYISGNYNQVSQDSASNFANNTLTQPSTLQSTGKDKRNWIIKILNSNWTITIIGAIIAGIVVAYFIFRLKWNK